MGTQFTVSNVKYSFGRFFHLKIVWMLISLCFANWNSSDKLMNTSLKHKHFNGHLICVFLSKFLKTKTKIYYWLNELNTELNDSKDNHNFDVIIQSDDTFKFLSKVSFHHTILSQIKVIFTWFYNKVIFSLKKQFIRAIKLLWFFLVNNFIDDWWHRYGLTWS